MSQIVQQGSINTNGLNVPDVYIQIVPPPVLLNGVPSNILGIVGTAQWGPVNSPTVTGGVADTTTQFGAIQARKYDLGTAVKAAALQGASSFMLVRVTDGTDTSAAASLSQVGVASATVVSGGTSGFALNDTITLTGGTASPFAVLTVTSIDGSGKVTGVSVTTRGTYSVLPTNPVSKGATSGSGVGTPTFTLSFACITFTAKYTGTLGNNLTVSIGTGSSNTSGTPTYKVTVAMPGQVPEVYDNIGGTGNTLYTNIATAINSGQSGVRGPSLFITATAGAGTTAPTLATTSLSGGTDGATTITSAVLVGSDSSSPRTGMYALRSTGASVVMLADADDTTQWTSQAAFALSENVYVIGVSPAGDTLSNIATSVPTAGIDTYGMKILFGDWCYLYDDVNSLTRLVSPQGFSAGKLSALSPERSSLNKPLYGIIGTQKSTANQQYTSADIGALASARVDVISNPCPGGSYFGPRLGLNTSSNASIHDDNYPRLTNYIAKTLGAGMGIYIGQLQSLSVQRQAKATIESFLQNMWQQNMIGNSNGTIPFRVILNATNNPQTRVALGYMQADVQVQYLSVIRFFLVNLQGGQTVVISQSNPTAAFQ